MHQPSFTPLIAEKLQSERHAELEGFHNVISLKFYYQIKEKLLAEQLLADQLLNIEQRKQDMVSDYTFVLDPSYFEQRLLPS